MARQISHESLFITESVPPMTTRLEEWIQLGFALEIKDSFEYNSQLKHNFAVILIKTNQLVTHLVDNWSKFYDTLEPRYRQPIGKS